MGTERPPPHPPPKDEPAEVAPTGRRGFRIGKSFHRNLPPDAEPKVESRVIEQVGSAHRLRSALIIAGVSVVSAALYFLMYRSAATAFNHPTFEGACQRIRDSGIPPNPGDLWCSLPVWHYQANVAIGSLLFAIGFAFPVAVLAATGRRATALLPLVWIPFFVVTGYASLYPGSESWLSTPGQRAWWLAVTVILLAAPGIAVFLTAKRTRPTSPKAGIKGWLLATLVCGVATATIVYLGHWAINHHTWFGSDDWLRNSEWAVPAVAIGLFGALLGPSRRWWPWALAVAALFLSQGLSNITFFEWRAEKWHWNFTWSMMGVVLPLFLIGLVWSSWSSLACRLARTPRGVPSRLPRTRWSVAMNVIIMGTILTVSTLVSITHPFPRQTAWSLPTYLEERDQANDVRARMDLARAMRVADAYRAKAGTFEGFDAETGANADEALAWANARPGRLPDPVSSATTVETVAADGSGVAAAPVVPGNTRTPTYPIFKERDALTIQVVRADARKAVLAVSSHSGHAFCLQHDVGEPWRYGRSARGTMGSGLTLSSAIADCGANPWTSELVARPTFPTCTAGSKEFLICRMMQVLMFNILKEPTPRLDPHHWTVVTVNGDDATGPSVPNLQFIDGRINGWTGCTPWRTNYTMDDDLILVDPSSIEFSPLARVCPSPTQESDFLAVVGARPLRVAEDGDGIELTSPGGTLRLRSGD